MAVGVPEGRSIKAFLAAVSCSSGNGLFYGCRWAEKLTKHLFKFHQEEEMGKEIEIKSSRPLTRLLNRADADGSLYGIMGGAVIRRAMIKRSRIVAWLIFLS